MTMDSIPTGGRSNVPRRPIAVIAPCPFPANHGTPGSIREIVQHQVEEGHDVHVFTFPLFDDVPLNPNVRLHRVKMLGRSRDIKVGPVWQRPFWDLLIVYRLCKAAREHEFSLIHAYNYEGALFGWLAHRWLNRPLVCHHFNTMIDELPSYGFIRPKILAVWLAKLLDRAVPRLATRTIAISKPIVEFLRAQGVEDAHVSEIPMGIDPSIFEGRDGAAIRREYDLGNAPLIVYAGLLNRFQRIDYLLSAMASVAREQPEARLLLVTNYVEPRDLQAIRGTLAELRITDRVIITAPEPFERVPDYLAAADVCVVPRPDTPGVAVKMLNYMAAGKAVVVPKGSAMDLQHDCDAYIVPDHDPLALARGLLELLGDEQRRHRLGAEAKRTLDRCYSLRAIGSAIDEVYREVLDSPSWQSRDYPHAQPKASSPG